MTTGLVRCSTINHQKHASRGARASRRTYGRWDVPSLRSVRGSRSLIHSYDTDILKQTVETLGRLPDPWWSSFSERGLWFEEDGEPKSAEVQALAGVLLRSNKSSIRAKLRAIGTEDDRTFVEGPMIEKSGVRLSEEEVELLQDLLERMLRYHPEERIGMREVVDHPWLKMSGE